MRRHKSVYLHQSNKTEMANKPNTLKGIFIWLNLLLGIGFADLNTFSLYSIVRLRYLNLMPASLTVNDVVVIVFDRHGQNWHLKGALKAHKHISLYESYTLQEQDATILFLSVIPWGEIFAYCHPPRQPLPATGCGHVFQVLSAVTQSGGRDHILSPSYLWAVYLTAVLLTRALCTSCIKMYISNKKMVKSCAAIGCKKRHGSGESFHRFPSSKFRQTWFTFIQLLNEYKHRCMH